MKDRRDRLHLDLEHADELPQHTDHTGILLTGLKRPDPHQEVRGERHRTRQILHDLERGGDPGVLDDYIV